MAGFQKAKAEQAAIKALFYGGPGSGKTFTACLMAEGVAKLMGKRVAFVDTEHGTDFYVQAVPERPVHPEAFDLDALYTRSLTEVLDACRDLNFATHGVIVVDSVSHLWETAINSYRGHKTRIGSIPMHAWGPIKKPFKDLMSFLLNSPFHVFLCGRQATDFEEDDAGELKAAGLKVKCEKETGYEPHIVCRMESVKFHKKSGAGVPTMFVEKDRSGLLQGQVLENPDFKHFAAPLLGLLGGTQAQLPDDDAAADQDARTASAHILAEQTALYGEAASEAELEAAAKRLTDGDKEAMLRRDLAELRTRYRRRLNQLRQPSAPAPQPPAANGHASSPASPPPPAAPSPAADAKQPPAAPAKHPAGTAWRASRIQMVDDLKRGGWETADEVWVKTMAAALAAKLPWPSDHWDEEQVALGDPLFDAALEQVRRYWQAAPDGAEQLNLEQLLEDKGLGLHQAARAAKLRLNAGATVSHLTRAEAQLIRRFANGYEGGDETPAGVGAAHEPSVN
jgi:hypothetical protein